MSDNSAIDLIHPAEVLSASHDQEQLAIATFLARYRNKHTHESYTRDLHVYLQFCRDQHVGPLEVERGHLELFIAWLESSGLAQATVAGRFSTISSFLEYAEIDGRISKNPARAVKRPTIDRAAQHRPYFEIGEILLIMAKAKANLLITEGAYAYTVRVGSQCKALRQAEARARYEHARRDHAVVQLMVSSGIRVGELCSLDVDSLHVRAAHAFLSYVRKGSKHTDDSLPLSTTLTLRDHIDGRDVGPMFLNDAGRRITRANVDLLISRLARSVGITRHVPPHGTRRTFATTAFRLGASQTQVQASLNHVDGRNTLLYRQGDNGGGIARHLVAELIST